VSLATALLVTNVVHWWSAEPERLSAAARRAMEGAEEVAVADVSWYELAWLVHHGRIDVARPVHMRPHDPP
jgi:PIN domain nuclease of toxin-antitoxin system